MKKILMFLSMTLFVIAATSNVAFMAEDFSGREAEMNQKCAVITDYATQQECIAYKEYLDSKRASLGDKISKIESEIAKVQGTMEELEADLIANNAEIEALAENIKSVESSIEQSEKQIDVLNAQIDEKTLDIQTRDENMKARLVELQPYTSSNQYIDFIMGSKSFADLLRRSEIISELSSYESMQMELLAQERASLDEDKSSVKAQKELLEAQKENLDGEKRRQEALKRLNEKMIAEYRKQEEVLYEEKVKLQLEQTNIPEVDTTLIVQQNPESNGNIGDIASSDAFIPPLIGEYVYSAGTWAYPMGGLHRGIDFGTYSQGLPVVAPANGIVIWTYTGCPSPNGNNYPNTCGIPMGGGNNILFLCEVEGIVYAMPMYHLQSLSVSTGQMVSQGQQLGLSGNSGNSTGPHLHIEIIKVGEMSLQDGVAIYNRTKDFTFGTGWGLDPKPCGEAPCRLRPELYWQ